MSKNNKVNLLIIEDNPGDIMLVKMAFKRAKLDNIYEFSVANDGEEGLNFLYECSKKDKSKLPKFILLDINMPKMNGLEFLEHIKVHPGLRCIPVILLTSSELQGDIKRAYDRHANAYLVKPFDVSELTNIATTLDTFWNKMTCHATNIIE